MKSALKTGALLAAFALTSVGAQASTVNFAGDFAVNGYTSGTGWLGTGGGLVVDFSPSEGEFSATLEEGQSKTVTLFNLSASETFWRSDDATPHPITVDFAFTSPEVLTGQLGGTTQGVQFLGFFVKGQVQWDDPLQVVFGPGDSGLLTISLNDATFKQKKDAQISATFEYATAPIPLPAGLPLLLSGIAAFGFVAHRRRKAAA